MPVVVFSILIKEIEALARKRVNNGRPLERERERKKERERETGECKISGNGKNGKRKESHIAKT